MSPAKKKGPPSGSPGAGASSASTGRGPRRIMRDLGQRGQAFWRSKSPVLRLVIVFSALMGLYYAATLTPLFNRQLFPAYLSFTAEISNFILHLLGQATGVSGTQISGGGFSVDVRRGCEAVEPSVIFIAALLAFPSPLRPKLPCLFVGTLLLQVLNLLRVVSLYWIGRYHPRAFETLHVDVWQLVFIVLAVVLCVLSLQWMARRPQPVPHAPG